MGKSHYNQSDKPSTGASSPASKAWYWSAASYYTWAPNHGWSWMKHWFAWSIGRCRLAIIYYICSRLIQVFEYISSKLGIQAEVFLQNPHILDLRCRNQLFMVLALWNLIQIVLSLGASRLSEAVSGASSPHSRAWLWWLIWQTGPSLCYSLQTDSPKNQYIAIYQFCICCRFRFRRGHSNYYLWTWYAIFSLLWGSTSVNSFQLSIVMIYRTTNFRFPMVKSFYLLF